MQEWNPVFLISNSVSTFVVNLSRNTQKWYLQALFTQHNEQLLAPDKLLYLQIDAANTYMRYKVKVINVDFTEQTVRYVYISTNSNIVGFPV